MHWIIWSKVKGFDILNISWIYSQYIAIYQRFSIKKKWPKPYFTCMSLASSISPRYIGCKLIYWLYFRCFMKTSFNHLSMQILLCALLISDISDFFILDPNRTNAYCLTRIGSWPIIAWARPTAWHIWHIFYFKFF